MKKIITCVMSLALLMSLCVMPATAANAVPAATDWFACQDLAAPTHSVVTAKNGRIIVESVEKGSAMPGAGAVWYTQPIDFDNFEVSFSLDKYTKCRDQYFGIYFVNGGTSMQTGINDTPDPCFVHLLRPTDLATVIGTGEGVLYNYDVDRDMIRVGKSSFTPGQWLEGEMDASWTNVVYSVRKRADAGYDVLINGKVVNAAEQNKWEFIDKIEAKTGCTDWYVGFSFKDGDYGACKYTIKTINGQSAVDPSVEGYIQNSLLPNGGKWVAVGGKLGQYVSGGSTTDTTTTGKEPSATVGQDTTTTVVSGDTTTAAGGEENTTTTSEDVTPSATPSTNAPQGDAPTDTQTQTPVSMLWVGIAIGAGIIGVICAGVCVYLLVIRPRRKK